MLTGYSHLLCCCRTDIVWKHKTVLCNMFEFCLCSLQTQWFCIILRVSYWTFYQNPQAYSGMSGTYSRRP